MKEIDLITFNDIMKNKTSILVFTGAGASADSGIATFRGSNNSIWTGAFGFIILPFFGTPFGWNYFPRIAWFFFNRYFRQVVFNAKPNACHQYLAEEAKTKWVRVITQNVDGLHQRAGTKCDEIAEIHGSVWNTTCVSCENLIDSVLPQPEKEYDAFKPIVCPHCSNGGFPRPMVTLFKENIPYLETIRASEFINEMDKNNECSVVLLIGTSGMVNTLDFFLNDLYQNNRTLILIDPNPSEKMKKKCNFLLKETAQNTFSSFQK